MSVSAYDVARLRRIFVVEGRRGPRIMTEFVTCNVSEQALRPLARKGLLAYEIRPVLGLSGWRIAITDAGRNAIGSL